MRQAEVLEDLQADAVVARVGAVAEGEVGLDGVEPLVLEGVGPELLDQADPAALLGQVDQGADPLVADHLEGQVELVAAVAAERVEQVAGEAGRVHPDQRGRRPSARSPMTMAIGSLPGSCLTPVADDPAPAVAGRQLGLGEPVRPASRGGGGS